MDEIWFAGIDLGGTTIKLAFINQYGEIQHKWEVPTDKTGDTITVTIAKTIDSKLDELQKPKHIIKYIGMGAPGPVDMAGGGGFLKGKIGGEKKRLKKKI